MCRPQSAPFAATLKDDAIRLLLDRAVEAGEIRDDVPAEDLWRALIGIFYAQGTTDWQPGALRMVEIFVDGLRKR